MKDNYFGTIIEESLEDSSSLKLVKIISTKVEKVTEKHRTPWIKQWTMHSVEITRTNVSNVATLLSQTLDSKHAWYADFKNSKTHYILFRNKIFKIQRKNVNQYNEATRFGLSVGIPSYQLDFARNVKK